jgi:hypothetical protein
MSEETLKFSEIEVEGLEEDLEESTPLGRKIYTDKGDPEVDSLYGK